MIIDLHEKLRIALAHIDQYEEGRLTPAWHFLFEDYPDYFGSLPILPDLSIRSRWGTPNSGFSRGLFNRASLNRAKFVEFANGIVAIYGGYSASDLWPNNRYIGLLIVAHPKYGWKHYISEMSLNAAHSDTLIEDYKRWIVAALLLDRGQNDPGLPLMAYQGLTYQNRGRSAGIDVRDARIQFLYPQVTGRIIKPALVQINTRNPNQPSFLWGESSLTEHISYVGQEYPSGFHGFPESVDSPGMRSMLDWIAGVELNPWSSEIFVNPSDELRFMAMT